MVRTRVSYSHLVHEFSTLSGLSWQSIRNDASMSIAGHKVWMGQSPLAGMFFSPQHRSSLDTSAFPGCSSAWNCSSRPVHRGLLGYLAFWSVNNCVKAIIQTRGHSPRISYVALAVGVTWKESEQLLLQLRHSPLTDVRAVVSTVLRQELAIPTGSRVPLDRARSSESSI